MFIVGFKTLSIVPGVKLIAQTNTNFEVQVRTLKRNPKRCGIAHFPNWLGNIYLVIYSKVLVHFLEVGIQTVKDGFELCVLQNNVFPVCTLLGRVTQIGNGYASSLQKQSLLASPRAFDLMGNRSTPSWNLYPWLRTHPKAPDEKSLSGPVF